MTTVHINRSNTASAMPARTNGSATATATAKPAAKRFELPALDFKFSSLTEGTDIPPPLPSPIAEESPLRDASNAQSNGGGDGAALTNGAQSSNTSATLSSPARSLARPGLKRSADDIPASPTLSSRPGSIRRLFSRNLLNTAYANGEPEGHQATAPTRIAPTASGSIIRPDSRSDGSILDERRSRRSSGWFRRLRGGAGGAGDNMGSANGIVNGGGSPLSKRSSVLYAEAKKPAGPPPPVIPELGELQAKVGLETGSLGGDLFKDIK